jgi:hypothetical protein
MTCPTSCQKVGEHFDIWHAGHMPVECMSQNDNATINVRMPDGDVVVAEYVFGNWMVKLV